MGDRLRTGRPPSHWNAYRPSYDSPVHSRHGNHPQASTAARLPPPPPPLSFSHHCHERHHSATGRIPFHPRHARQVEPGARESVHEQLPQIWDDELEELIGRTLRAYDLVIHYEQDSHGGQRWSPDHIELIHHLGKNLHDHAQDLKHWQRSVARHGDQDKAVMRKIHNDVEKMRAYCLQVQQAIRQHESQFLPVDEQGNIYVNHTVLDRHGRPLHRSDRDRHDAASHLEHSAHPRLIRSQSPEPEACHGHGDGQEPGTDGAHQRGIAGRLGSHIIHY